MHFHLPKPLHGWREFTGEVGIIVLGVLIALGAEQILETLHLHEKVRRAEHAMQLELAQDDGPQAYARVAIADCFDHQLALVHDGAGVTPTDRLRALARSYSPPFRTWDSEAWKAVVASDVGSYMGPEKLVEWSAAYRVLPGLNDSNVRENELATELHDTLPPSGEPSPADLQNLRRVAGQLKVLNHRFERGSQLFLARTLQLSAGVPAATKKELIGDARSIYGSCVSVPDLSARPLAQGARANLRGFIY
jgi:hypothetical protein